MVEFPAMFALFFKNGHLTHPRQKELDRCGKFTRSCILMHMKLSEEITDVWGKMASAEGGKEML